MKIKEITVSAGLKLSKHYQTCDSRVTISAELDPLEGYTEVYEDLSILVHDMVEKEIAKGLTGLELSQN